MTFLRKLAVVSLFLSPNLNASQPAQTAGYEVDTWKAYYAKDLGAASQSLKPWIESIYKIPDATKALPYLVEAMVKFGQLPMDTSKETYENLILPIMETGLQEIRKTSAYQFDANLLAKTELDWWVARRIPAESNPENVADIMAGAYALLYGGKAENYTKAAYLRATAARYRDLCQDKFKNGINDADWKIISNLLTASYEAIKVPN